VIPKKPLKLAAQLAGNLMMEPPSHLRPLIPLGEVVFCA
jgi:hypothetical protein